MATTSIWRVKGWLGKVVIYAENPEKTANPKFYADRELTEHDGQQLTDVIRYAVNSRKTQKADNEDCAVVHRFVSGINCSPSTARDEMLAVKKRFGKESGTVAYHGYQSFAPGEATPEMAHEIGMKLAARLWGDRYQVIVATHLDKENHLHNHFVLNTVSFADGIKYHRTRKDYHEMQTVSDALCREYGLSVIEHSQQGRGKQYGEWRAEQEQRPTWRGLIRADMDEAIRQSMTERQFFDALRKKGYAVKVGKDISIRPPGKERFVRLMRNFGEDYSIEQIRRRILSQTRAEKKPSEPTRQVIRIRLFGSLKTARKLAGFRALYVHYCYLLGIFPKNRPQQSRKRMHFLLREDLLKLDAITAETRLLIGHRIDTAEQLFSYRDKVSEKITVLTEKRKQLYKTQRTAAVKSAPEKAAEVKTQITALSKELAVLRKEVVSCNSIAERSGVIKEKIKAVREDEHIKEKEKCDRTEQQKAVR
ncbi:relaxase/mobilization nuclease domain-containing protein [Hominenteromicrobium sp.]|uniref:relaxase/mobilization nuclease domain-containing protein n=1 Tax=Hominenteromicrobium sp. TaxID=3073581 RepID=UPI003A900654